MREEARQHMLRSVAMFIFLWIGVGISLLIYKWLFLYLVSAFLIYTVVHWRNVMHKLPCDNCGLYHFGKAPPPCPHGFEDWDDCPDCRH